MNQVKYKYCYGVYQEIKKISKTDMGHLVEDIQQHVRRLQELRKTVYCSVCDYDSQQYFDHDHKTVMFGKEFCSDLI